MISDFVRDSEPGGRWETGRGFTGDGRVSNVLRFRDNEGWDGWKMEMLIRLHICITDLLVSYLYESGYGMCYCLHIRFTYVT